MCRGARPPMTAARSTKLSSNENPLGTSPAAREAFLAAATSLERYPDASAVELREAIAAKYGLDPARIIYGNGSDEVLHLAAGAFAGPGDEVIYVHYGFTVYPIATRRVGAIPVVAPDKDYATDVDAILACGNRRDADRLHRQPQQSHRHLCRRARRSLRLHAGLPSHVLLVLDHAYAEYIEGDDDDGGMELAEPRPTCW